MAKLATSFAGGSTIMARGPALTSMSIDKLVALREEVEAAIATKVIEERRTLQAELGKLSRYSGGGGRGAARGRRGGTVAPKYRNPANPSEAWAGRGLKPRWLAAAIKSGKKLEDFAIAGARRATKKK
jgi:DNA-binding protein H-NS